MNIFTHIRNGRIWWNISRTRIFRCFRKTKWSSYDRMDNVGANTSDDIPRIVRVKAATFDTIGSSNYNNENNDIDSIVEESFSLGIENVRNNDDHRFNIVDFFSEESFYFGGGSNGNNSVDNGNISLDGNSNNDGDFNNDEDDGEDNIPDYSGGVFSFEGNTIEGIKSGTGNDRNDDGNNDNCDNNPRSSIVIDTKENDVIFTPEKIVSTSTITATRNVNYYATPEATVANRTGTECLKTNTMNSLPATTLGHRRRRPVPIPIPSATTPRARGRQSNRSIRPLSPMLTRATSPKPNLCRHARLANDGTPQEICHREIGSPTIVRNNIDATDIDDIENYNNNNINNEEEEEEEEEELHPRQKLYFDNM